MSSHCVPELSSAWHFPVLSPPAEGENSNKEQTGQWVLQGTIKLFELTATGAVRKLPEEPRLELEVVFCITQILLFKMPVCHYQVLSCPELNVGLGKKKVDSLY